MFTRDKWILVGCFLLAIILCIFIYRSETVETSSWGLSFRTEGAAPVAPENSVVLGQYDAAYIGNASQKKLYLTFDAGYENGCTAQILDILRKHQVPAAFFLVGSYMQKNADLVRQMAADGHIVGNHTMEHPDMSKINDPEKFSRQLQAVEDIYREITGQELPKYYRPPQGIYSQENLQMAKDCGYKTVFWSLAYADWDNNKQPSRDYALGKLIPRTHNGAVILLHSTSKTNAQLLDELLTRWKNMGYTFGTLDELFA